MAITVEEFAANLIRILSERQPHPQTYLLTGNLISTLQMSLVSTSGVSAELPRMLYKPMRTGEDQTRIVEDVAEQQAAKEEGFRTAPSPQPPGFPQMYVEVDPSRGSDWRRLRIRNDAELKLFREVTDADKWVRDDEYRLAGRPIGLDEVVQERKEKLKAMVDASLLVVEPYSDNVVREDSGAQPSAEKSPQ